MAITPLVKELLEKIYSDHRLIGYFGPQILEDVKREPEVHLIALLIAITEELPDISSTLRSTVRLGIHDSYEERARALLEQDVGLLE